jgi:hypothetical protein
MIRITKKLLQEIITTLQCADADLAGALERGDLQHDSIIPAQKTRRELSGLLQKLKCTQSTARPRRSKQI